jgi:predicted metal-dependent phosphotriesterase family hydrolase
VIQTVRGPIEPGDLGLTLPHEHVFINLVREYRGDGLLNDEALMKAELARFAERGGTTLIDCTSDDIGRDPEGLRGMSAATGLNIIMGCGHYRDPYLDPSTIDRTSTDRLADELVRDLTEGVRDTGVRAGIIGEIGSDKQYISAAEERSFRAAGRAQVRTGVPITTHAARWPVGTQQLDILEAEGVDPRQVIIGHCDMVPLPDYHMELARRGVFVQFDTIRGESEYDAQARVDWIMSLVRAGHLSQILISQDICLRSHLHATGGPGFAGVLDDFVPRLRKAGLNDDEIACITTTNIRRAFGG